MSGNDLESLIQTVNLELCLLNINKTYLLSRLSSSKNNDNSIRMNDSIINSASH